MASRIKIKSSDLMCLECGNITTIQRAVAKQFPLYNKRINWCSTCKKNVMHIELQNADVLNKKLEFIGPENNSEAKVYQLMKNNNRL